jgi:hypothetical protein
MSGLIYVLLDTTPARPDRGIGGDGLETRTAQAEPGLSKAPRFRSPAWSDREALIRFNASLERESPPARLDEGFLEARLEALEGAGCARGPVYGLTLARLIELTLLCAGDYADSGCLSGVGDLLFNPRLVLVHIRGRARAVVKERHTPLTVQFAHTAGDRCGVVSWLRSNTFLETVKGPLLPRLVELYRESCSRPGPYLARVRERASRIVELTTWISAAGIPDRQELHAWAAALSDADRKDLERRLCRFDRTGFDALGREIRRRLRSSEAALGAGKTYVSLDTKAEPL